MTPHRNAEYEAYMRPKNATTQVSSSKEKRSIK